jgi:hypothetical protein
VAFDFPGSATERLSRRVLLVISIALFAAMSLTTGIVALKETEIVNAALGYSLWSYSLVRWLKCVDRWPLKQWRPGVTLVWLLVLNANAGYCSLGRRVQAGLCLCRWYIGLVGSCAWFILMVL